jgi:hypothetical protein
LSIGAALASRTVGEISGSSSIVVDTESGRGRTMLSFLRPVTKFWKKGFFELKAFAVDGGLAVLALEGLRDGEVCEAKLLIPHVWLMEPK